MSLPTVEIALAGVWTCPECGHENFVHAVTRERKPGHPSHDPDSPDKVTLPDEVACLECGRWYANEESA